jgi:deoxyhypusine monooxygenase
LYPITAQAAEALGAISSTKSLPILRHYLNDSNVSVRETCELALKKIEFDHAPSSSSSSSSTTNKKEESEGSALARAKAQTSNQLKEIEEEEDQVDSAFLPIDPAPAHSHQTQTLLSSIPLYQAQLTAGDSLPLFDRYRAVFSLRNAVHAARTKSQAASIATEKRKEFNELALSAILALAKGLSDKSALFRHEICFVFGELAHPGCVESMVKVLGDDGEEEMVRHEAAEALGAVVEEASENKEEAGQEVDVVMTTLQKWATNEKAPRVVRESCLVALDEMAYNNDPTQFQPVPVATA